MLLGYGRVALYTTSSGGFRVVPRVTWNPLHTIRLAKSWQSLKCTLSNLLESPNLCTNSSLNSIFDLLLIDRGPYRKEISCASCLARKVISHALLCVL